MNPRGIADPGTDWLSLVELVAALRGLVVRECRISSRELRSWRAEEEEAVVGTWPELSLVSELPSFGGEVELEVVGSDEVR